MNPRPGLTAAAALAVLTVSAEAGRPFGPCDSPEIFQGGALNVVVLPYDYRAEKIEDPAAHQLARELPLLIQAASLMAIVDYSGVGATGLVRGDSEDDCSSDHVLRRLDPQIRDGQALVLVWGTLYEDSGSLRVQTHVRFLRKGTAEFAMFRVNDAGYPVALSAQTLVFPPRMVPREDLQHLHDAFERARVLRTAPRDDAVGVPMNRGMTSPAYSILEVEGDWARVRTSSGGEGFVRLRTQVDTRLFEDWFPEIAFIDGAGGFLRFQQRRAPQWKEIRPRALESAAAALRDYVRRDSAPGESVPRAVALQMLAVMMQEQDDASAGREARQLIEQAAASAPYSAEAKQWLALSRMQAASRGDRTISVRDIEVPMVQAVRLAPDDPVIVRNLRNYYDVAGRALGDSAAGWPAVDPPSAARYRAAVSKLDQVLALSPDPGDVGIDLNSASLSDIRQLPGVSGKSAEMILVARPFEDLYDPSLVRILGKAGVEKIADLARVVHSLESASR